MNRKNKDILRANFIYTNISNTKWFYLFLLFELSNFNTLLAQNSINSKEIASIISKNCMSCHYKGGPGAITFETTQDIQNNKGLIKYVLENSIMPPWKADPNYNHFRNERVISNQDKETLLTWLKLNKKEINPSKLTYNKNINELSKPDYTIKPVKPYQLNNNNEDAFITFIIPIDIGEDKMLKAIEIVPSNKKVVHHCRVDFEISDKYNDLLNENGYVQTKKLEGIPYPTLQFVGDYVPGIKPYIYPQHVGFKIYKKMYVLINIHYSPTSIVEYDQTKVNLYFYKNNENIRQAIHNTISIDKTPETIRKFYLPADSVCFFSINSLPIEKDISLFAIQPHMHLFGKSMKIIAITPSQDTINLINIENWDFNWQENYYFKNIIKIPKNSFFYVECIYDNTSTNPRNPFIPPQKIYINEGMKTINEMLEFYIQYIDYKEGDENIIL